MTEPYASRHHRHLDTEAEVQRLQGQVDRLRRELDEVLDYIAKQQEGFAKAAETLKFIDD